MTLSRQWGPFLIEAWRSDAGHGLGVELWHWTKPPNEDPYGDRRWDVAISIGRFYIAICWGRFPLPDDDE